MDVFSKHGEITQLKLHPKRRFAFVGYHTDAQAKAALRFLHDSYIDTSKIQIEIAHAYGDDAIPRAWSKFSTGSSAFQLRQQKKEESANMTSKLQQDKNKHAKDDEFKREQADSAAAKLQKEKELLKALYTNDPDKAEMREFVNLMGTRKGTNVWANDPTNVSQRKTRVSARFEQVDAARPGGEGVKFIRQHLTFDEDESDNEYQTIEQNEDEENKSSEVVVPEANPVALDQTVSDADYFRSKIASDDEFNEEPVPAPQDVAPIVKTSKSHKKSKGRVHIEDDKGDILPEKEETEAPSTGVFTLHLAGLPFRATEDSIGDFFAPIKPTDVRIMMNAERKPSGLAYVDFASEKDRTAALAKNNEIMQGRYIEVKLDTKTRNETQKIRKPDMAPRKTYPNAPSADTIVETGRIFVRNLSYKCTEEDLRALFEPFGPISEIALPTDSKTKKTKAIAFVTFLMPEHAVKAYSSLDGKIFQGRLIHLIAAVDRKRDSGLDEEHVSYAKKQVLKRKAESETPFNWNTLFMRSATVVDAMAVMYGVTKGDLMDQDTSASTAVRMALGETHIIAENKEFLKLNGVDLDAFDTRVSERNKSVILVKNLPYDSTSEEIRQLFARHGNVGRVVFPPSHTMALVEFLDHNDAQKALRSLAYTKFKTEPLYLEYAPVNVFKATPPQATPVAQPSIDTSTLVDDDDVAEDNATVFVKNLNFETTEDALHACFAAVGPLRFVRIATKPDVRTPGAVLSMGFGFVEFRHSRDAKECIKTLQGTRLDEHELQLKLSTKQSTANQEKQGKAIKARGTKLLVKNIPFEATKHEIRELFAAFGQLKSVRMPSKFDGSHRGFAFVDLLSEQEAKNAFSALSGSTHLYGRRLVIEWAKEEETIDNLREKTNKYFDPNAAKRRKVGEDIVDDLNQDDAF